MSAMLADFLAWIWPALPMFFFAGLCFVLAGSIWWIAIRRHEVAMGPDPVIPPVVEAATVVIPLPPKAHLRIEDDTHVIPCIPGATRVLNEFIDAVEDVTTVLRVIEHEEEAVTDELLHRVRDGLRAPVCSTCGGPFGNCSCYSQKSGSDKGSDATQVVDLCPLTTQALPKLDVATPHFAETFTRHPRAELGTQELSGSLARAKECAA